MTLSDVVNDVIYGQAPVGSLVGVFDEQDERIWALGFLVFLVGAYFIPTAIAFSRDARSRWLVAVINALPRLDVRGLNGRSGSDAPIRTPSKGVKPAP